MTTGLYLFTDNTPLPIHAGNFVIRFPAHPLLFPMFSNSYCYFSSAKEGPLPGLAHHSIKRLLSVSLFLSECKQESLIRMLNAKIRGWEHIISMGFHVIHFTELTIRYFRLVAMGLSPFQEREWWIKDRYWHNIRGNSWTFAAKFKKSNGKGDQFTLLKLASSFPFL